MLEKLDFAGTRLLDEVIILPVTRFRYSFICQGTLTRRNSEVTFSVFESICPV